MSWSLHLSQSILGSFSDSTRLRSAVSRLQSGATGGLLSATTRGVPSATRTRGLRSTTSRGATTRVLQSGTGTRGGRARGLPSAGTKLVMSPARKVVKRESSQATDMESINSSVSHLDFGGFRGFQSQLSTKIEPRTHTQICLQLVEAPHTII